MEYRYQNAYPAGPCTLVVRGESVAQGGFSQWGKRLASDTRELERGWLVEESRDNEAAPAKAPAKRRAPVKTTKPKGRGPRIKG